MPDIDYRFRNRHRKLAGLAPEAGATSTKLPRRERQRRIAELREFAVLSTVTDDDLVELSQLAAPFCYPANWPVAAQGAHLDAVLLLTEGTARLLDGHREVERVRAGQAVGELTAPEGTVRRLGVTSATRLSGLRIELAALRALAARRPSLAAAVYGPTPAARPAREAAAAAVVPVLG